MTRVKVKKLICGTACPSNAESAEMDGKKFEFFFGNYAATKPANICTFLHLTTKNSYKFCIFIVY